MIDRSRPHVCFRRRTWIGAVLLSLALAVVGLLIIGGISLKNQLAPGTEYPPAIYFVIAAMPLFLILAGAVADLLLIGVVLRDGMPFRYALFKIAYCCPRCRHEGPPLYRCPGCGTLHEDLRPSIWGHWHARCGQCGRPLATTDWGGRREYEKVCPHPDCGRELPALVGRWAEYHLAVVGRDGGLLLAGLRRFEDDFARPNGLGLTFVDPEEEAIFRRGGEAAAASRRWTVAVQPLGKPASLVYLSDLSAAGPTERYLSLSRLDGLLFVFDPPVEGVAPVAQPGPRGRRFALAVAGVVRIQETGPPPVRDLAGLFVSAEAGTQEAGRDRDTVRRFLVEAGLAAFVEGVEQRFERVGWFAVVPGDPPRGAATPLVWLLGRTGALTDASPVGGALAHLAQYWRRVLAGDEGHLVEGCLMGGIVLAQCAGMLALLGWLLGRVVLCLAIAGGACALWWAWFQSTRPRREEDLPKPTDGRPSA
jgi:hypothetical protein